MIAKTVWDRRYTGYSILKLDQELAYIVWWLRVDSEFLL